MTRIARLSFNPDECLAHRACSVASRVFGKESEDRPDLPADVADYLDADRDLIIEAVMACPMSAIALQFADGKVVTSKDYDAGQGVAKWTQY